MCALLGAFVLTFVFLPPGTLSLETIKTHQQSLLSHVEQAPWQSAFFFFALYVLVSALSIPGAAILTLLTVMSKLTNAAWKQLTGRDLMLDPISAVQEGVSAGREAAQQGGAWQALWKGVSAGVGELGGNLPYISGGRIGTNLISDAIDAVGNHFTWKNK